MKKKPAFRILDTAGTEWISEDIIYPSLDTSIITFLVPFGGTVICS